MSGITWAGGNKFYVIRNDNHLCVMTVSLDGNGNLTALPNMTDGISLEGASDPEGIAFDMASGQVWVSDETGPSIREFDPSTGKRTGREVPIPPVLKKVRKNLSLESLTISPDGLIMWTANEEALTCDGNPSVWTKDGKGYYNPAGTVVRLVKFRRRTVQEAWVLDGMWAYKCNPVGSLKPKRSGVADLVALPDGSLAVMERCVDASNFSRYIGTCWLYRPSFDNATDVRDYESLADRTSYTPVNMFGSNLINTYKPGLGYVDDTVSFVSEPTNLKTNFDNNGNNSCDVSCYEGICLGPQNKDGSINLMIVSDGGSSEKQGNLYALTKPFVRALKLTGLDIHTLSVNKPAPCGDPTFYGQNYRFVHNATVTNELYGEGVEPRAYTNSGDLVYSSWWSLPAHGKSRIAGRSAVFNITKDDTLTWNVSHMPNYANTPIYAHDTFEEYVKGANASDMRHWTGSGEVIEKTYTPKQGANKYILKRATHTKVLDAADDAVRSLNTNVSGLKSFRVDVMIEIQRSLEASLAKPSGNPRLAIAADKNGHLKLWYRKCNGNTISSEYGWGKLTDTQFSNGDWVRVSFKYVIPSSGQAFASVLVNGEVASVEGNATWKLGSDIGRGPWFPVSGHDQPTNLEFAGTKVDDFIMAASGYIDTVHPSASIMVAPAAAGASGAAVAGGQAYTVATAVAAPVAASGAAQTEKTVSAPAIIGFGIAPDGRPHVKFKGVVAGVGYRVVRSTSVDFKPANCEHPDGLFTTEGCKDGEAVWEGAEPDDPSTGAKFYRVEVVEAAAE